jgi:NAD(P)-dependent dehydrogenase (short-subunit alcohol dehydrogenase family)
VKLDGKTALLTGATGGIGQAIAQALHGSGAKVILTGRRVDVLEDLRRELGDRVEVVGADLANKPDVERLGERDDVDVLVANAAVPAAGRLQTFSEREVDRALDVNLRAPMQLTLALLPKLLERGSGHLVYVSSLAGKVAAGGSSVYSATKSVFPGFIREAGMFHEAGATLPRGVGTRTPEDVASAVLEGIEKGRAEIDVAPFSLSSGAKLFGVSPPVMSRITRMLGADRVSDQLEVGQKNKR